MDEPPLRKAMLRYSVDILLISLVISGITAALVYLTLALHVRAADAPGHRQHDRVPRRPGESPTASSRRRRAPTRSASPSASSPPCRRELASMLQQKSRLAALGLAVSKINHDLRNLLGSAQLISDRLSSLPDPRRAALRAQADARARARHRLLPVDAVLRPRCRSRRRSASRSCSSRWSRRCTRRSASAPMRRSAGSARSSAG